MRVSILIFAAFLCGVTASVDEEIDIDVSTIKPPITKAKRVVSTASGDGEDSDNGSGVQGDSSGSSGSGEVITVTPTPKSVEGKTNGVVKVTTKEEPMTKKPAITTEDKEEGTEKGKETTVEPIELLTTHGPTTPDEDMMETEPEDENDTDTEGDLQASTGEKKKLRVLTTEVIAAVVVGGICAIILIGFLVYRLRKRDEGSYVLTDSSYKDTNKLRGEGKEAFV